MPVAVVKLGSSIVAEDNGELRLSVVARICEEVAALHRSGVDVVIVTSGAIARGIADARPAACARRRSRSCRRPARSARGGSTATYDELLRERGIQSAQILLTFFDMSVAHALRQRAADAAQAARVADRAGDQRERHDHHRRDLLRRQRLPGRAGGGAGRRRAAAAADRGGRALHGRSALRARRRSWSRRSPTPRRSTALDIGHAMSPLGSRRDALQGGRGRDGAPRPGIPTVIAQRARARRARRARGRASAVGTRFAPQPVRHLELQAVAQVREADARRR